MYAKYVVVVELSLPLCIQCLWTNGVGTAECVFLGRDGRGFIVRNNSVAAWLHPAHRRQTQHFRDCHSHSEHTVTYSTRFFAPFWIPAEIFKQRQEQCTKTETKDLKDTSSQTEQLVVISVPHTLAPFVGGLVMFPSWVSRCSGKSSPRFLPSDFPKLKF